MRASQDGPYHGGHPGNDGYVAAAKLTEPLNAGQPSHAITPAERLRALDDLRTQGLVSDAEYAEKRKAILQEF